MNDGARASLDDQQESSGLIGNLPMVLWQRRWLVIVPAVLIAVAALAAAYLLPRKYESKATLLVESQDLPGATAAPGGDDPINRRIAKIRQQILSRPDLVELIQANDLYNASAHSEPLSKLVDRMRDATTISAIDADIQGSPSGGKPNSGSIAFSLSFAYPRAAQAQIVAQTFVDRLLKLSATSSQDEAQTNVAFLEDQESNLQAQVQGIESQINRIAGVNGAALSSAGLGMVGAGASIDYAGQIAALQRENAALNVQTGVAVERDPNVTAAEAALAAAKAQYSDNHPDVKLAESRLAAARANSKQFQTRGVSAVVQQQLSANNRAIADLQRQRGAEQSRAAALAAAQARGPQVAQQVQQLQARADIIRANLAKVSANLLTARSMAKLADQQRGERLTLIDPPVTPDHPTSPNRPLLIVGGIVGGLAVGLALALLVELVLRPIRSAGQLTNLLGEPPLAVVPVLSGKGNRRRWLPRRFARS
ncbi:Wzz/FepE/Etk N-terminal domain-containing protein [Sphingomonas sp. 3P27F8]|uniref:Wzz/FepE/Etk N-terminal domain-containing protein n=1 Tax=Sphingomonas sp. 3P27F8 TaxID=2502213 RepID=UPI0010F80171|nr:Wzz/FepE/Etk N-terminal domain-containing protein [Sphingomonas sp. 3P27F8]